MSITYPIFLPVPNKSDLFGLNINKSQFAGEFTRNRITQSHGAGTTDRWEGVYTTPFLGPDEHREMSAILTAMSVDDGTFFAFNPNGRTVIGNHDGQNLLGIDYEQEFSNTITTIHVYLSNLTDGNIRSLGLKGGDTISGTVQLKSVTGADSAVLRIDFYDKDGIIISTNSGSVITSSIYTTSIINNLTIPNNTVSLIFWARNNTVSELAFSRRALLSKGATPAPFVFSTQINGAGQTGTAINIKGGSTSTNGFWRPGTMIQIETAVYEVAKRVDIDGAGKATVEIRPAIRSSHPDGEVILVKNPVMIGQLVKTDHPQETNHRGIGVISFAWQEVV